MVKMKTKKIIDKKRKAQLWKESEILFRRRDHKPSDIIVKLIIGKQDKRRITDKKGKTGDGLEELRWNNMQAEIESRDKYDEDTTNISRSKFAQCTRVKMGGSSSECAICKTKHAFF